MNSIVRSTQGSVPAAGTQDGNWVWDGQQWQCAPCGQSDSGGQFPFCPPPGFPPPGCPPWFSGLNSPPWYPGANAGVSFGTTAPQNPVRGHFWWNGKVLQMFDGAVWVSVGGGAAQVPGVTDGTVAAPGMVGEVVRASISGSITNLVIGQTQFVNFSSIVMQPGDWDMMFRVTAGPGLMGVACFLTPMPAGVLDDMHVIILGYSVSSEPTGEFQSVTALSPVVQGSFAVPTLMAFQIQLIPGYVTGITEIDWTHVFRARRMR